MKAMLLSIFIHVAKVSCLFYMISLVTSLSEEERPGAHRLRMRVILMIASPNMSLRDAKLRLGGPGLQLRCRVLHSCYER